MNTASRMESCGTKSKIHISQTTADQLIEAGKSHWITKRQDLVEVKGKISKAWKGSDQSRDSNKVVSIYL